MATANEKRERVEQKHRKMLQEIYNDSFEYLESRAVINKANKKHMYYLKLRCTHCNTELEKCYGTLKKGKSKCLCQDITALKKSAKIYAKSLYQSILAESVTGYGMLEEHELMEYIESCAAYDRAQMSVNNKYSTFVFDEILELYKKYNVTRCECCNKLIVKARMYTYDKRICKTCNKKLVEERKVTRRSNQWKKY